MSERPASKGPSLALLLLIPAAVIVAKSMRHHRAMWESAWTPSGATGYGHRHRGKFGGAGDPTTLRLPPRIESMLDTWHTRAHDRAASAGTAVSADNVEPGAPDVQAD